MISPGCVPDCFRSRFLDLGTLPRFAVGARVSSASSSEIAWAAEEPVVAVERLLAADSKLGQFCADLVSLTRFAGGPARSAICIGAEGVEGDNDAELRVVMLPTRLGGLGRSGDASGESTGIP